MIKFMLEYFLVKKNALLRVMKLFFPKLKLRSEVSKIPPVVLSSDSLEVVAIFCGRKELYEAFACLHSFYYFSKTRYHLMWFDDGTLTQKDISEIKERFVNCSVIESKDADTEVEEWLNAGDMRRISELRNSLIFGKRLTSIFYYLSGKRVLQLDSDVLFLKRPEYLLEKMEEFGKECFQWHYNVDVRTSYCASIEEIQRSTGIDVMEGFNAGVVVFSPHRDDLLFLEEVSRTLIVKDVFFWEQTLFAIMAKSRNAIPLPDEYEVHFRNSSSRDYNLDMCSRHYCSDARPYFYSHFNGSISGIIKKNGS
jgi:hypothetical protein